jgi:hypothetical protein
MAVAMVLHRAVSAELFVDCNGDGFFLLAKFAPILEAIREKNPGILIKTSELVGRFSTAAAQRGGAEERGSRRSIEPGKQEAHGRYSYPQKAGRSQSNRGCGKSGHLRNIYRVIEFCRG